MTYLGIVPRLRLGHGAHHFAPSPHGAKGRDRRPSFIPGAASTTSEPKVAYRPLLLTDKKHPRLTGPGA